MPNCHVCGGEEFEEADGLFYCSVCQTQSQTLQSVELEETDGPMSVSMGTLREIGQKKKSREHSEHFKNEYESGRPWSKYEAYQLIMQAQADALIIHGAHLSLKDAVLRLWAKYLSQLGVAFTDKVCLIPKSLEKIPWKREVSRGDFEHPEVNPKRLRRNIKNSEYITSLRKSPTEQEKLQDASAILQEETFYKEDNPFENDNMDDGSGLSSTELYSESSDSDLDANDIGREQQEKEGRGSAARQSHTHQQKLARSTLYRLPEHMSLRKTLVFCYLGCLFTSPWITLSDIIRWAAEGSVPYLETTHLLQSDMKLTAYDSYIFKPRHLLHSKLLEEASTLANYLRIKKLPPFAVKWIISRYIVSLDLPVQMHKLVLGLYTRTPVDVTYVPGPPKRTSVPNVDAVCIAYIVVLLKLLFGLDDSTERQLSLYTNKIQTALGSSVRLFDWYVWRAHATRKFLITSGLELTNSGSGAMDVDSLCRMFHSAGYQDQTFCAVKLYNQTKRKKDAKFKQENREMLKRPLNTLLERWCQREERADRLRHQAAQLTDSPSSDRGEQAPWNGDQDRAEGSPLDQMSADDRADMLKKSTLCHITEPERFLHKALAKVRERDKMSPSSEENASQRESGSPRQLVKPQRGFSRRKFRTPSLPSRFSQRVRNRLSSVSSVCSSSDMEESPSSPTPSFPSSSRGTPAMSANTESSVSSSDPLLADLLSGYVCARDSYIIYPRLTASERKIPLMSEDSWERKHFSYRWLLSLCQCLTFCSVSAVEKAVIEIEQHLLACDMIQRLAEGGELDSAEGFEERVSRRLGSAPKHACNASESDSLTGSVERTESGAGVWREDQDSGDKHEQSTQCALPLEQMPSSVASSSSFDSQKRVVNTSFTTTRRGSQPLMQPKEEGTSSSQTPPSASTFRRPPAKRRQAPPRRTHTQQLKHRDSTGDSDSEDSGEEFAKTRRRLQRSGVRQLPKRQPDQKAAAVGRHPSHPQE